MKIFWLAIIFTTIGSSMAYADDWDADSYTTFKHNDADNDVTVINDSGLFPGFKIHLGAEVVNLVHLGVGFRISRFVMIETNIATPVVNTFFLPVLGVLSIGSNIQLFDNDKWILNVQIPAWFMMNTNDEMYWFPSLNIGWFNLWQRGNHYENIMIRGGVSYLAEYHYKFKEFRPRFIFFNIGCQIGISFTK